MKTGEQHVEPSQPSSDQPKSVAQSIYALALNVKSLKDSIVVAKAGNTAPPASEPPEGRVVEGSGGESKTSMKKGGTVKGTAEDESPLLLNNLLSRVQALEGSGHGVVQHAHHVGGGGGGGGGGA